jgi:hypothetical protein
MINVSNLIHLAGLPEGPATMDRAYIAHRIVGGALPIELCIGKRHRGWPGDIGMRMAVWNDGARL